MNGAALTQSPWTAKRANGMKPAATNIQPTAIATVRPLIM